MQRRFSPWVHLVQLKQLHLQLAVNNVAHCVLRFRGHIYIHHYYYYYLWHFFDFLLIFLPNVLTNVTVIQTYSGCSFDFNEVLNADKLRTRLTASSRWNLSPWLSFAWLSFCSSEVIPPAIHIRWPTAIPVPLTSWSRSRPCWLRKLPLQTLLFSSAASFSQAGWLKALSWHNNTSNNNANSNNNNDAGGLCR